MKEISSGRKRQAETLEGLRSGRANLVVRFLKWASAEQGLRNEAGLVKAAWWNHLVLVHQCKLERLQDCSASCSSPQGGPLESVSPPPGLEGAHAEGCRGNIAWSGVCYVSSDAPAHCSGAFLTDRGYRRQKPALCLYLPPVRWSCTAIGPASEP